MMKTAFQSVLEVNKVYTLKLNSGEELIGRIHNVDQVFIQIEDPVSIAPGPNGLGLVPSLFTAKQGSGSFANINISSVAIISETDENVKTKYTEAVTGITVPDKKVILG